MGNIMKFRQSINLPLLVLFLTLTSTVLASTTWYVDGVNGSDTNDCQTALTACKTIGHAISLTSLGDSIIVAAATYSENLTISTSLSILGSGANQTVIDGGRQGRVLNISNGTVTLFGVTIRNGLAQYGAGIFNGGTLSVVASTISGNTAKNVRYCLYRQICAGAVGGGISNGGTLTISGSAVVNNGAQSPYPYCSIGRNCFAEGGGIFNGGNMIMTNSALADNTANSASGSPWNQGGGIFNTGTAMISNSTLSGNSAYPGGSISGSVTIQNSIVANSPSGGNCSGTVISNGYNLSSDNTCNFNGPGDLNNTDPKLGSLGYYGGSTPTILLLSGSPAIDAGNPSGCTDQQGHLLTTDQRGMPRPDPGDTGGCDMGAYESQND
jgi:hypothetical protein